MGSYLTTHGGIFSKAFLEADPPPRRGDPRRASQKKTSIPSHERGKIDKLMVRKYPANNFFDFTGLI